MSLSRPVGCIVSGLSLRVALGASVLVLSGSAWARAFRVNMIPNGSTLGCAACHVSPAGGGARNSFGTEVGAIVGGPSSTPFWGPALAAKDSDGDGFTNGEELGDPDGDGVPIAGVKATYPGNAASKPASHLGLSIAITNLVSGQTLTAPAVLQVGVAANNPGGTVAKVEIYDGDSLVASAATAPFLWTLDLPPGSHSLTAKGYDANSATTVSAAVKITVNAPFEPSILSSGRSGGGMQLAWTGGGGPFGVEAKTNLSDPWGNWEVVTTNRTALLSASSASGFYRVADLALISNWPMSAFLSGAAERPVPVPTGATGAASLHLTGNTLGFTIEYTGLSGPAAGAHIHGPAGPEETAGVWVDLEPFNGGSFGTSGTIVGSAVVTSEQKAEILAGKAYINFHTEQNPGGEIRGQIRAQ